ncbi:unnamed protein product [[Actinomadura] parvosata subsp. kistnae]|uniref:hypothetical protein n=1 Tax=[Actinomadura] parvosata TaxID=1955412 RepID=UPI000D26D310|nr:unnamed protein product [Actinomadura parvosata subsp. kistnae]
MSDIGRMMAGINPMPRAPEQGPGARELLHEIVGTPVQAPRRRPRLLLMPVAALLATAAVLVVAVLPVDAPSGIAPAAALAFHRSDDGWVVTVKDLYADPERFVSEFRARGFDIELSLQPGSPSVVGKVMGGDSSKEATIEEESVACGPAGDRCTVSFRIPADFQGGASIWLARPARQGERYVWAGDVDAPGELLHCVPYRGMTVDRLRAVLAGRDGSIESFRVMNGHRSNPVPQVPGTWLVEHAAPTAPGQVVVWAQPDRTVPDANAKAMAGCPKS